MMCALLCMHDLYFSKSALCPQLQETRRLLLDTVPVDTSTDLQSLVDHKREALHALPSILAGNTTDKHTYETLDMDNITATGTATMGNAIVLAIVYPFLKDTLAAIDTCISAWTVYEDQEGFADPARHIHDVFGRIQTALSPFRDQVSSVTLAVHSGLHASDPDAIRSVYTASLQHHTHIMTEYTNRVICL